MKSFIYIVMGEFEFVEQFQYEVVGIVEEIGWFYDCVVVVYSGGWFMFGWGDFVVVVIIFEDGFVLVQKYGICLFVLVVVCYFGMVYWEQGMFDCVWSMLIEVWEEVKVVGYILVVLCSFIYFVFVIWWFGDGQMVQNMFCEVCNIVCQQGFFGLEVEVLFGEVQVMLFFGDDSKVVVVVFLWSIIVIVSESGVWFLQ